MFLSGQTCNFYSYITYILAVNSINDSAQHIALETACQHTVHMWRIQEHSVLVVAVDNRVDKAEYLPHIEEALEIIEQGKSCNLLQFF